MTKLILLNGFAAAGKSSLGKKYIEAHPLTLLIEGDELIVNLGQWVKYENAAREIVFTLTKNIAHTQLRLGHDVVVPYLVTEYAHVDEFRTIAIDNHASFYNILLHNERSVAIANLMKRGSWGEADLPRLDDNDLPNVEKLYDSYERQLDNQPDKIIIHQENRTLEETFTELITCIGEAP
jgi:predicted kinase